MRSLRCAVILVAALTAGSAVAQTQWSISDYRVTSLPSQPGRSAPPPMERIQQTAATPPPAGATTMVPAFLPPPPATPVAPAPTPPTAPPPTAPPPGVVLQPAPPVPAPIYMPLPPRPTLPAAGGPLNDSPAVTAWARAEALLWWVHGKGLPTGATAFGGEDPISDPRWGGRLTAGLWIDCGGLIGVEASYFRLGGQSAEATGTPAVLPDFMGVTSATLDATNLSGADAAVRVPVYYDPNRPRPRVDLLVGYRWLHYAERLDARTDLTQITGRNFVLSDRFRVRNNFHGAMVGLAYGGRVGEFTLDVTGRASLGHVWRQADIDGGTTVTGRGPTQVLPGGILTQPSNIGGHDTGEWTVIPELELRLGYDVTSSLRLTAGYSLLVLNDFARVGNVIDPTGQPRAFNPSAGVIWVHGLNVGAELRF